MTRITIWSIPVSGDKGILGGELKHGFTIPSFLLSFAPSPSLSLNRKLMFFNIPLYLSFTPSLEPLQWARHSFRSWGCTIPIYPYLCNKHVFNIYSELRTEAPPLPALSIFSQAGKWQGTGHRISRLLSSLRLWFQKRRKVPYAD